MCASLRKIKNGSAARLAALLRRQTKLKSVSVSEHETLPAFSQAIAQGCCRGVENIELGKELCWGERPVDQTHLDILAGAFEVDGALPAIKTLKVHFRLTLHVLSKLAGALMGGTLPLLEHLNVAQPLLNDDELNLVADMVGARACIPGCQRLKWFCTGPKWLKASPGSNRLLRALLPSLREITHAKWDASLDTCIRQMRPPHLESMNVHRLNNENLLSLEALEAIPALKNIDIRCGFAADDVLGPAAFRPMIAALQRGIGLGNLQKVRPSCCALGDMHFCEFLEALEGTGCAERIVSLVFHQCGMATEGARALANLLRGDGLPALEELCLSNNDGIGEEGIVAVAKALCEAPRTMLRELDLSYVGMGDVGMTALASIIDQGRMQQMQTFPIFNTHGTTDESILTFTRAIDTHGLPRMQELHMVNLHKGLVTAVSVDAITRAFVNRCPELRSIFITGQDQKSSRMQKKIKSMLRSARKSLGRVRGTVTVSVS